ncbi:hypothetical protein AB4Z46_18135 [Variovorax sp. M-6]|uniref:hypothetical protein n=1 Tax=Variovorax sp. M-6 TaxID=3233041 RepID=UPI003F9CB67C
MSSEILRTTDFETGLGRSVGSGGGARRAASDSSASATRIEAPSARRLQALAT